MTPIFRSKSILILAAALAGAADCSCAIEIGQPRGGMAKGIAAVPSTAVTPAFRKPRLPGLSTVIGESLQQNVECGMQVCAIQIIPIPPVIYAENVYSSTEESRMAMGITSVESANQSI